MSAEQLDRTWPSPLPDIETVREIFDDEFGYQTIREGDTFSIREMALQGKKGSYDRLRRRLHKTLSVQTPYNDARLSGRKVQRGGPAVAPYANFNGLNFDQDILSGVLPSLRNAMAGVLYGKEDLQVRLDRTAAMLGVITAESQTLSDANTRVARTIHDYVQRGRSGLDMDRITDTALHFSPPQAIEDLLRNQHVSHLIDHPFDDPLDAEAIGSISSKAEDAMAQSAITLGRLYQYSDISGQAELLEKIKDIVTPEPTESSVMATAVLTQKQYSSAAWAVAFGGKEPPRPLSVENAHRLVEANYDLLRMRIAGLALGVLRGGKFISVSKDASGRDRSLEYTTWWPTASI